MRTPSEIRADFLLDPEIAFLNHGSFGATPRPVLARQAELRAELERNPVAFLARRVGSGAGMGCAARRLVGLECRGA